MEEAKQQQMQNVLDVLQKELNCPICLSVLDSPSSLPCNHFFCSECLDKLFVDGLCTCPMCKQISKRRQRVNDPVIRNICKLYKKLTVLTAPDLDNASAMTVQTAAVAADPANTGITVGAGTLTGGSLHKQRVAVLREQVRIHTFVQICMKIFHLKICYVYLCAHRCTPTAYICLCLFTIT